MDEALIQVGAEALWRAFNGGQERPLPPELRWDHEKAARAVLEAVLPLLTANGHSVTPGHGPDCDCGRGCGYFGAPTLPGSP